MGGWPGLMLSQPVTKVKAKNHWEGECVCILKTSKEPFRKGRKSSSKDAILRHSLGKIVLNPPSMKH